MTPVCMHCNEAFEQHEGSGVNRRCRDGKNNFAFEIRINPEVLDFIKENPDKSSEELARLWIDRVIARGQRLLRCDFRDAHDRVRDLPTGNRCEAQATHRIEWDGRYSLACDQHLEIDDAATVKPVRVMRLELSK